MTQLRIGKEGYLGEFCLVIFLLLFVSLYLTTWEDQSGNVRRWEWNREFKWEKIY